MSYTVEDIFKRSCSLIDSMTDDGDIDSNTTGDYRGRALTLTDMALKELGHDANFYKLYEISNNPVDNMFGKGAYFEIQQFEVFEDLELECINGERGLVKAYYFESDSNGGTAYIEDYTSGWNTLATVSLANTTTGYQAYSGSVTGTTGATKSRIRFSGTTHYNVVNIALFDMEFELGKIPVYRKWTPVSMPTDLRKIKEVKAESSNYTRTPYYRVEWEDNAQTLYIDYYFSGKVKVQYYPFTTIPTAFTDSIEIDDLAAQAIAYFLAMNFVATEQNNTLVSLFRSKFDEIVGKVMEKQVIPEVPIVDHYGGV